MFSIYLLPFHRTGGVGDLVAPGFFLDRNIIPLYCVLGFSCTTAFSTQRMGLFRTILN